MDNPNTDYDSKASCLITKCSLVNVLRIISLFATVDFEAVDDQCNSYCGPFIEEAGTRVRCYLHADADQKLLASAAERIIV